MSTDARPTPSIRTIPEEARPYQGQRAGLVSRVIANLVDLGAVVLALLAIYAGWAAVRFLLDGARFRFPTVTLAGVIVAATMIAWAYFTLTWTTTGRTYGDHLLGLRVVNHRGERVRLMLAMPRALFCVLVPLGLLWVAVSSGNRSLQDVVLRTSVTYDWEVRAGSHDGAGRPAPGSS